MIKTWQQRCEEHPDHDGIVSDGMIQARMQEEIDELRDKRQWRGLTDEDRAEVLRWIEWKEIGSQPIAPQKLIAYVERKLREKNT